MWVSFWIRGETMTLILKEKLTSRTLKAEEDIKAGRVIQGKVILRSFTG